MVQQLEILYIAKDVARAMMLVVKKINEPINIGSGEKTSIKQIVKIIQKIYLKKSVLFGINQNHLEIK